MRNPFKRKKKPTDPFAEWARSIKAEQTTENFRRAFSNAFLSVNEFRESMLKANKASSRFGDALFISVNESMSIVRYHQAVRLERAKGRLYVRELGDQARRDLGLKPEYDPRYRII